MIGSWSLGRYSVSYDFIDVTEQPRDRLAPTQLIYGGLNLDKELHDFYRTVNAFGRDPLGPKIKLTDRTGGPGAWIDSAEYPDRTITVQGRFEIDRKDLAIRLDPYFGREVKTLKFSDMPDWNFDGILSDVKLPSEYSDAFFGDLIFSCPNPRMYSDVKTLETDDHYIYFPVTALGNVEIQRLEIFIDRASEGLRIDNIRRRQTNVESVVLLNNLTLAVGDRVVFDFIEGTITHHVGWSQYSLLPNLSLLTDFEGFKDATREGIVNIYYQNRAKVEYVEVVY